MAYLLHMPVYVLMDMPYEEFIKWSIYFNRRPVGWREDDRTYKLLQAQGVKAKPAEIFPTLARLFNNENKAKNIEGQLNIESLKKSALFHKMLSMKGGDKIDLDN